MHYKWLFGTLATERICSAVLLNCTKARIEPLFELNRTAASVASSNNGMPTFSTPSTQKKNSCRMLEGEKNNLQANTRKKKFIVNQGVEKKFHDQTKSPTPPPPPPQKSNSRPLITVIFLSLLSFWVEPYVFPLLPSHFTYKTDQCKFPRRM